MVGRRVFATWEITNQLLEDRANGIQDQVWKHVLEEGKGARVVDARIILK